MKFDETERAALADVGFAITDDHKAAHVDANLVIRTHDDDSYWLTIAFPNRTNIVCVVPRDQLAAAITGVSTVPRERLQ